MSLALSSSHSRLILVLASASSAWGVEIVIVSLSEVFEGPTAALPAAMFLGMITGVLSNSG